MLVVFFIMNTTIIIFTAFHLQAAVFLSALLVQLTWGTEWASLQSAAVTEDVMTYSFANVKQDF